jgi:hypothetical protein
MPQHNILILNTRVLISRDPRRQTLRWAPRVLRHVAPGWEFLLVGVSSDVHGVAREACAVPDKTAFFGHEAGDFAGDEFVGDGVFGVRVEFVGVGDVPGAAGVVVADAGALSLEGGFARHERVAVAVLLAADGRIAGHGIDFEHCVGVPVDARIEAQAEEVLVVVRVDARVDFCAVGRGGLAFSDGVGGEDAGEFDFELDDAVLVQNPVDAVFVVAGGEDLADDEFAGARGGGGFVAEVRVFEEDAVVFFVDADCVFDGVGFAVPGVGDVSDGFGGGGRWRGLTFGRKRRLGIGWIPCSHSPC